MIDETNEYDLKKICLGDHVIATHILCDNLFVETENYLFLIKKRKIKLFAKWFGLFKVVFILEKEDEQD